MNLNWNKAKELFQEIINKNGTLIQWLQRSTDASNSYNILNNTTYGYGDQIVTWITGSIKALVSHVSATDVLIEPGFYAEDYEKIYVDPDSSVDFWEQVIVPSGSGIRYLVLPFHLWRLGDVVVAKHAVVRKLIPKSGSSY